MSHIIQPGASLHGIALNHDFQQSPLGSLGGRSVQQGQAQAPRSLGRVLSDVGRSIQSLASRVLNAVTPHGVRAESKVRAGLKETSAQVGELLGALSHSSSHAVDGASVQQLLGQLHQATAPLTSRGLPHAQAIAERAAVHLAQMTPAQRQALHTGLAMAENSALKGDPTLAVLRRTMEQRAVEQGIPALQDRLDLAIAMVAKESQQKGITGRAFADLYNSARDVLKAQGFGGLPPEKLEHLQRALILQALERRLDPDDLPTFQATAQMINHLPSRELHALMHEETGIGQDAIFNASTTVMGAIGRRADLLEQQLGTGFAALLQRQPNAEDDPRGILHAPQDFAREVAQLGQALADLREHTDLHGMHFPPQLSEAYAQSVGFLESYLDNPAHLMQLPELNARQLHGLQRGLQQLGVEAGQTALTADAARRRTEAGNAYTQALLPGLQALAQGQAQAALELLAQAQPLAKQAMDVHMQLGMKVDGADQIMALRDTLMQQAIDSLDTQTLQALSASLNSQQLDTLMDTLVQASVPLLSGGPDMEGLDQNLGRTLFDRNSDLGLLRVMVDQRLQEQGVDAPPPQWPGDALDMAQLLRAQYQVVLNDNGSVNVQSGLGGSAVQHRMQANIDDLAGRPESLPRHAQYQQVSQAFIADLTRDDYRIADDNGQHALFDPQVGGRDAAIQAALTQLDQLTGGNPELMLLASRLAHQGSLAGLIHALGSQQSPLRLDDGTPGRLMGPEHTAYTFSSDDEGGLLLRVDYSVHNATHFLPSPRNASEGIGRPVELDAPQSSAQFGFTLHIGADLSVQISEPLRYSYQMQRA